MCCAFSFSLLFLDFSYHAHLSSSLYQCCRPLTDLLVVCIAPAFQVWQMKRPTEEKKKECSKSIVFIQQWIGYKVQGRASCGLISSGCGLYCTWLFKYRQIHIFPTFKCDPLINGFSLSLKLRPTAKTNVYFTLSRPCAHASRLWNLRGHLNAALLLVRCDCYVRGP